MIFASSDVPTADHIRETRSSEPTSSPPTKWTGEKGDRFAIAAPLLAPVTTTRSRPSIFASMFLIWFQSSTLFIAILGHDSKFNRRHLSPGASACREPKTLSHGPFPQERYWSHSRASPEWLEFILCASISTSRMQALWMGLSDLRKVLMRSTVLKRNMFRAKSGRRSVSW